MKKVILLLLVAMAVCGCKNKPETSLNSEVQKLRQEVAQLKQQLREKELAEAKANANTGENARTIETTRTDEHTPDESSTISFHLYGHIGQNYDCSMTLDNGEGTVYLDNNTRDIAFNSYNPETGQLVLDSYFADGKYIGQYIGKYNPNGPSYVGTFYNVKGSTVEFSLYER